MGAIIHPSFNDVKNENTANDNDKCDYKNDNDKDDPNDDDADDDNDNNDDYDDKKEDGDDSYETWVIQHLKSLVTQLFVQQLFRLPAKRIL